MARSPAVGAHVSSAGRIDKAIANATGVTAETFQIFGAAPQQWRRKQHPDGDVDAFRAGRAAERLGPAFIHAIYLINLATPDDELLAKSIDALAADLALADRIGASGVIVHVGSHLGSGFEAALPRIAQAINRALDQAGGEADLLLENAAGEGNKVGSSFQELAAMAAAAANDRVKVCLDTCHLHAAGYAIHTAGGLRDAAAEFNRELGAEMLAAVHANDSKTPLGSGRDRHENIGRGSIGLPAFRRLIRNRLFRSAPWLLEVPGPNGKGPEESDVAILRALRDERELPELPDLPEA